MSRLEKKLEELGYINTKIGYMIKPKENCMIIATGDFETSVFLCVDAIKPCFEKEDVLLIQKAMEEKEKDLEILIDYAKSITNKVNKECEK